jgi:pyocin large subunit-like protein
MTKDIYLKRAKNLLNSDVGGDIDGFVSKDGWVFRYNKRTNEFATAKPDGTIETLFRPKEGMDYWNNQINTYKPK